MAAGHSAGLGFQSTVSARRSDKKGLRTVLRRRIQVSALAWGMVAAAGPFFKVMPCDGARIFLFQRLCFSKNAGWIFSCLTLCCRQAVRLKAFLFEALVFTVLAFLGRFSAGPARLIRASARKSDRPGCGYEPDHMLHGIKRNRALPNNPG